MLKRIAIVLVACALAGLSYAESVFEPDPPINCYSCDEWNRPQEPFHVFGNTYYVGMVGVAAVLIDGGSELILLDAGLPQSAEPILANIRKLGFDPANIRTITLSHAHFDHAGGINSIQRYTGARVLSSEASAASMELGDLLADDPQYDQAKEGRVYPAVSNVVAVADNSEHKIGDVSLRAVYTPGHTPGGMTWTWQTCEGDRCLDIVYADSLGPVSIGDYRFGEGLGDAVAESARRIADLDCDIMLATHPFIFDMERKYAEGRGAFIDADACRAYGDATMENLRKRLDRENSEG